MASRASKKRAYRALHPKVSSQSKNSSPYLLKNKYGDGFPRFKPNLSLKIKWFIKDVNQWFKDLLQSLFDKLFPPKRCRLRHLGRGTLVWGTMKANFYQCKDCGLEFFTTDLSSFAKVDLERNSRCTADSRKESL
jgi:hypothetical protein